MRTKDTTLFQMPGHLIRRLQQISNQVFLNHMEEAGFDLTSVQFATLQALHSNPGIEQAQVAAMIAYDRATIGGVIDRLEQKGYVSRVVSSRDRRAREVSLTREGQRIFEAVRPLIEQLQTDILEGLDDTERQQFSRLAQKVIDKRLSKLGGNRKKGP